MIDPIIESILRDHARRIEELEKVGPRKQKLQEKPISKGNASEAQVNYLRSLGGKSFEDMTMKQAGEAIDKLLEEKKNKDFEKELESIEEPKEVDTDNAGLDKEDLM